MMINKIKHKSFFISFTLIILMGTLIAKPKVVSTAQNNPDLLQLEQYFESARQAWKIPGIAVAIVKDGHVVLAKGYGVKNYFKKDPVDEKTLFAIASNTKAFTAATLSILVDEKKITWDDKVRDYLPYFKLYNSYVSDEMTIRDLLCHRSGLKTFSGDLLWYETSHSTVEVIKRARYLKPSFGFRSGYGYSNIMFMAAGEIIPAVTGKSWQAFIKERIFKPLNMNSTNLGIAELKKYTNVSAAHYVYQDGKTVEIPYTTSDSTTGAGAINSNVIDMAQWIKMLLDKGIYNNKRILGYDRIIEMWSSQNPQKISNETKSLYPSTHFKSYGLGWSLADYHGEKIISHGGGFDGMISKVALVPEIKLGMVILSNSINNLPSALMYKIIDHYLGVTGKDWSALFLEKYKKRESEEMQRAIVINRNSKNENQEKLNLEEYTGVYHCKMYGDAKVVLEKNHLVLHLLPAPLLISDLTHMYYDTFQLKFRNILSFVPHGTGAVQFLRNNKGEVIEIQIEVPNRDFWFTELKLIKRTSPE